MKMLAFVCSMLYFTVPALGGVVFTKASQSKCGFSTVYCTTLDTGLHLTSDFLCMVRAIQPIDGYVDRLIRHDGMVKCIQCSLVPPGTETHVQQFKDSWLDSNTIANQALLYNNDIKIVQNGQPQLMGENIRALLGTAVNVDHSVNALTFDSSHTCLKVLDTDVPKDFTDGLTLVVSFRPILEKSGNEFLNEEATILALSTTVKSLAFEILVSTNVTAHMVTVTVGYGSQKWTVQGNTTDFGAFRTSMPVTIIWSESQGLKLYFNTAVKIAEDKNPVKYVTVAREPTFVLGCDLDDSFEMIGSIASVQVWNNAFSDYRMSQTARAFAHLSMG